MGRHLNPPQLISSTVDPSSDNLGVVNTDYLNAKTSSNYIANSTGIFGTLGWSRGLNATPAKDPTWAGYFFSLPAANAQTVVSESDLYPVKPGTNLFLTAEFFTGGVSAGSLNADIAFYDVNGVNISYNNAQITIPNGIADFKHVENTVAAPSNAATMSVRFYLANATATAGGAAVRRIRVAEIPGPWTVSDTELAFLYVNRNIMYNTAQLLLRDQSSGLYGFYDVKDPDGYNGSAPIYNYNLVMDSGKFSFNFSNVNTPGDSGVTKAYVDFDGVFGGSNFVMLSDERLKTDWQPLPEGSLKKLASLKSGTYTRTDVETRRQVGVSAQELEKIIPESVITDENGIKAVSYGPAALTLLVEMAKEIENLKSLVTMQNTYISNIDTVVADLQGEVANLHAKLS